MKGFRRYTAWIAGFALALCVLAACGTPYGIYHRVKPGENLYRISKTYNVEMQQVAELNSILDTSKIKAGDMLFIPGADYQKDVGDVGRVLKPPTGPGIEEGEDVEEGWTPPPPGPPDKIKTKPNQFIWPVQGKLSSNYGLRGGRRHDGIDILAPEGTPIKAAGDGKVIYSGDELSGYGNLVIIKHAGYFATVYAHNDENLVKKGDLVVQGDVIAKVGDTGRASATHLHFEVREHNKPRNPLFFLPKK